MSQLAFSLLGLPRLERDGQPVHIDRRRSVAVAIYLALSGRAVSREALAAFFWPEHDERSARTDLRRTLHGLNRSLGAEWFLADEEKVAFRQHNTLWIDVIEFRRLLAACDEHGHHADDVCPRCLPLLQQAVALYNDDFLAGFSLSDSPAFDDWQFFEGEQLRDALATALDHLSYGYTLQGDYVLATTYARRRLALDPLYEPAHRQLMHLYAWQEQPGAALRQYEQCRQTLAEELGGPPAAETTALYAAVKERRVAAPPRNPLFVEQASAPPAAATTAPFTANEVRLVTVLSVGLPFTATSTETSTETNTATNTATLTDDADLATLAVDAQRLLTLVEAAGHAYAAQVTPIPGADVLVLFGAGQAHEDDAERAVRMAVALQTATQAQGFNTQIGVSSGAAYCQPTLPGQSGGVTVLGPLVRLATQLRNQANANQILLDQSTYTLTRGLCDYQPLAWTLPGATKSSTVYQVHRLRPRATKVRGVDGLQAALIGRAAEMSKLQAALTKAQSGEGQIVAIVGTAGVGKSRLVEELKQNFGLAILDLGLHDVEMESKIANPNAKILWLEGRALAFADAASYWVFADLLRGFWSMNTGDQEEQFVANLRATLQQLVDQGYLQAADAAEIGPLLGRLLAVRLDNAGESRLAHVDPNQLRQRTRLAVQKLLSAVARMQPTVLVFEDLQWADTLSLDLITALLATLATAPLLLLCVYRPEAAQADGQLATLAQQRCPERFTELYLQELTPEQSRQLVASLLAIEALPAAMRDAILAKAQGNPLFLEEIIRVLIDSGQLYRQGDTWQAHTHLPTFTVPDTLQGLIHSRVDQLPADARHLLQLAAVLGRPFRLAIIERMTTSLLDIAAALRPLLAKSFVYQARAFPEAEYSFHHVLVRDAVYQALPRPRRQTVHQRAGAALEQQYVDNLAPYIEELAYHYDQADAADKAIIYLLQAGEKARRAYHNDTAATNFQRALQRLEQRPPTPQTQAQQLAALTGLGQLAAVMSQFAAAEAYLRQAISLSPVVQASAESEAKLRAWLSDLLLNWQPRPAEALTIAQTGLARLRNRKSTEAAMLYGVIGWAHDLLGDLAGFRKTVTQVVCFLDRVPHAEELRPTYGLVIMAYFRDKDRAKALVWMEKAQRKALQYQDLRWYGESIYAIPQIMSGKPFSDVLTLLQEAHPLLERVGDRKRANWLDADRAVLSLMHGHLDQAQTGLEQAVQDAQAVNQEHLADLMRWLGELYLAQGAVTQAIATLQQALSQYRALAINPAEGLVALAYAWLASGQRAPARGAFEAAIMAMGSPDFHIDFRNYRTCTRSLFANALCGLEDALADPAAFQAFCTSFWAVRPTLTDSSFTQWHLEPGQPPPPAESSLTLTTFAAGLNAPWQWRDPVGDATVSTTAGLLIKTPTVRELWDAFLTAPSLLQPITGDWVVQVLCQRPQPDRPAIGGLLLWQDKWHFLRLDWGTRGQAEVALQGCVNRQEIVCGRGRLPGQAIYLRLDRCGDRMRGFCSNDGERWYSVGQVDFAVTAPVQIGLFTASYIERLIDPGAYPEGTAIHFTNFQISIEKKDIATDDRRHGQ